MARKTVPTFSASPQQEAVFNWVKDGSGSSIVTAVAGSGKTTTLVQALTRMRGQVFFGAFNRAICEEIRNKTAHIRHLDLHVSTFHAAGMKSFRGRTVQVSEYKLKDMVTFVLSPEEMFLEFPVTRLVSLAKQAGMRAVHPESTENWERLIDHFDIDVPAGTPPSKVINKASELLDLSNANSSVIDFDDMLYLPLLLNMRFPQFDWVLVDEAQDTNAVRREIALRMMKPQGRMIAVGDPHQAIYGFTGADSNSLALIKEATKAVDLPLTVTYRCPKKIVEHARQWVKHIEAHPSAPEGEITTAPKAKLPEVVKVGDAVLCRLNAPLITEVYNLISLGIPARVEGREIGNGLKALINRWKVKTLTLLEDRLRVFEEREAAKFRAKRQENKAQAVTDKVQCINVLIKRCREVHKPKEPDKSLLLLEIDKLFGDTDSKSQRAQVTFSSIHKSKGREWETVAWITTPDPAWVRKDWEKEQETNLKYVATTRAMSRLILLTP